MIDAAPPLPVRGPISGRLSRRGVTWAAAYVVYAAGAMFMGWMMAGTVDLPWFAVLAVFLLVMLMLGRMGRVLDRVDPPVPEVKRVHVSLEGGDPWVDHNGLMVRPEDVPAQRPGRGALLTGLMLVAVSAWVAGLFVA